jgi:ribosome biogenesis GTPase / thiamine phosphate phosphatase
MAAALTPDAGLEVGLIVAGHGRHYVVMTPEGREVICTPRGKKSDAVVGDRVRWRITDDRGNAGVLEAIEPRRNLFHRQDEWKTKSFAANLDRLMVLVAAEPVFSESQLARALIAAEEARIEVLILLNKIDLQPAADLARARLAPYKAMGYEVLEVALKSRGGAGEPGADGATADTAEVIEAHRRHALGVLRPRLAHGATLVLGPSGTGKSTLVNLLLPDAGAQTGEISTALNSGRHTTTHTRWYWLDAAREGALIDSPGFQEFGIQQIERTDLAHWMPDLRAHLGHCRFHNCQHHHEPDCGVRAAVEAGAITANRYRIYKELAEELTRRR